jgi:ABC-type branched-subunit amino acid transport system ATPase component
LGLLVEQYYDFVAELADQHLVMKRGEIVAVMWFFAARRSEE